MQPRKTGFAALLTLLPAAGWSQSYDPHLLIELARSAVTAEVQGSPIPKMRGSIPPKAVFVTIEINGVVRGCRGTLTTRSASLEAEIQQAARSAAAHDPRYRPLSKEELKRFLVTVTIVDRLEPITNISGLTPEDGLVLKSGNRTGIVLPWEGKDPATRLKWAYRKAGVAEGSSVSLHRLVAERFRG